MVSPMSTAYVQDPLTQYDKRFRDDLVTPSHVTQRRELAHREHINRARQLDAQRAAQQAAEEATSASGGHHGTPPSPAPASDSSPVASPGNDLSPDAKLSARLQAGAGRDSEAKPPLGDGSGNDSGTSGEAWGAFPDASDTDSDSTSDSEVEAAVARLKETMQALAKERQGMTAPFAAHKIQPKRLRVGALRLPTWHVVDQDAPSSDGTTALSCVFGNKMAAHC